MKNENEKENMARVVGSAHTEAERATASAVLPTTEQSPTPDQGRNKHTPGPWRIRSDREACDTSSARHFVIGGNYVLAETKALPPRMTDEAEANARLIAAAPDLLDAARLTVLHFRRTKASGAFQGDDEHEAWTALDAAIAKAEGR